MEQVLLPHSRSSDQRVLILGGLGGIGKTQLAIAYAKRHRGSYDSIFWVNATSETTIRESLRSLARRVLEPDMKSNQSDDDQTQIQVSAWLSEKAKVRWLLIFDNHDGPKQYNIKKYFPCASQGSIIITSRSPELLNGAVIYVPKMENIQESLEILETRSGREALNRSKK
jgi:hypothetical protein